MGLAVCANTTSLSDLQPVIVEERDAIPQQCLTSKKEINRIFSGAHKCGFNEK